MNDWIAQQIICGGAGLMFGFWRKNAYAGVFMFYALMAIYHHQ